MIGKRFHFLVVQEELERIHFASTSSRRYLCLCDCGNTVVAMPSNLLRGATKSCGCWKQMTAGLARKTHGMSRTPEFNIWTGIRKRCMNPRYREYHLYGGKGVTIAERWGDFSNFYADMGPRPSPYHSIDRIESNGNYEPGNCRWATDAEQSLNTSRVHKVTYNGQQMSVRAFAAAIGKNYQTVYKWLVRKGLPMDEALKKLSCQ
jgi:hypothetical protein